MELILPGLLAVVKRNLIVVNSQIDLMLKIRLNGGEPILSDVETAIVDVVRGGNPQGV
jgi:hypothetical protein